VLSYECGCYAPCPHGDLHWCPTAHNDVRQDSEAVVDAALPSNGPVSESNRQGDPSIGRPRPSSPFHAATEQSLYDRNNG